jgi:hypothetical protein
MINERIFGSPISGQVRKKLEDRQRVAGEVAFGDSIEAVYPDKDGNNQADLSSRTPFVRMWTSVKLIEPAGVAQMLEKIELGPAYSGMNEDTRLKVAQRKGIERVRQLRENHIQVGITRLRDENGQDNYYIVGARAAVDYASKLYIVGDYNYQTGYGSVEPNESNQADEINQGGPDSGDFFPVELQNNPLLKPQAGITSVTSETEGTLGVIKRTVVNFTVHNFEDFDKIYNRYFLKPGATVFVDFGHSSVKNLYNPQKLIDAPDIKKFLYESNVIPGYEDVDGNQVEESIENIGEVAKYQGDLEVLQGIVVDYSAKVTTNGSVECSVTLISANSALLDFGLDDVMKRHIDDVLNRSTLFLGLEATLQDVAEGTPISDDALDTVALRQNTPNQESSATDIQNYQDSVEYEAYKALGSQNLTPSNNSIRTGVFVNSPEADDIYVCWGFIEDIVINANFGFGNDGDDINQGNNLQVRMDSSNQFTTWDKVFVERQRTLAVVPEEPPVFLYPEWWGDGDPGDDTSFGDGSYNYVNEKYPKIHYDGSDFHDPIDISKQRIPIREVFINVEIVTKAFQRNKNVRSALNDMLSDINNDSDGVFDWKITLGETDSELLIVDNNRPDINQRILDSGVVETQEDIEKAEREQFQNMFVFNIMSPNSIIKDYNLEFKLPQGNIGNMYAIQGMSHQNKVFPTSDMVDNAIAINSLDDDSLSIIYQPDNGGYRNMQIDSKNNKESQFFDVYGGAKYLLDNNIYKTSAIRNTEDILDTSAVSRNIESKREEEKNKTKAETQKEKQEKQIEKNVEILELMGMKVVTNFKQYYRLREIQEISLKTRPNLLPYTLSLSTYGIGSVQPGDTFRVDYLPKQHFKNTFLQTMKVTHNINSDGWYTSLDTQYRILSDKKQKNYLHVDRETVFLSPKVLNNLGIKNKWELLGVSKDNAQFQLSSFLPYMTGIKVKDMGVGFEHINLVLSFTSTATMKYIFDSEPENAKFDNAQYYVQDPSFQKIIGTEYENEVYKWTAKTSRGGGYERNPGTSTLNNAFHNPPAIQIEDEKEYFFVIRGETFFITDDINILPYFDFPIPLQDPQKIF